jgi:poly(A) polymerase
MAALEGDGEAVRIVGGAVRDALIGRPVLDADLATTAIPETTVARARAAGLKPVPTGIAHGTVTVVCEGEPFEVTTLREDVETDGRHAVVRFGRDFDQDALRRDFTINALSLAPDGRLHDPAGGLADLARGRVRFIGEADTRIREDYLRVLRFFRFHAGYGAGEPDREGLLAAIRGREGLDRVSRERVRVELLKLVVQPGAAGALAAMAAAGLLQRLTGGVAEIGRLRRASAAEPPPDAVGRLAAALVLAPPDADRLRERLRLANAEHGRLAAYAVAAAALRDPDGPLDAGAIRRIAVEHGASALADALAALAGEPRPRLDPDAAAAAAGYRGGAPAPVLPLRGADLRERGFPRGPALGEVLAEARRLWLAEGCPTGEDARAALLARLPDPRRGG